MRQSASEGSDVISTPGLLVDVGFNTCAPKTNGLFIANKFDEKAGFVHVDGDNVIAAAVDHRDMAAFLGALTQHPCPEDFLQFLKTEESPEDKVRSFCFSEGLESNFEKPVFERAELIYFVVGKLHGSPLFFEANPKLFIGKW
jgi:hypothetical protein